MVLLRTLQEAGRSAHRSSITSIESKASFYGAIDEYNSLALIRQENDLSELGGDDLESDAGLTLMLVHMGKVSQSLNTRQNEWTTGLRNWW